MSNLSQKELQAIGSLFALCVELNRKDFSVFVEFSGHVDWISFSCYFGGWDQGRPKEHVPTLYLKKGEVIKQVSEIVDFLQKASDDNPDKSVVVKREQEKEERAELDRLMKKYGGAS